MCPRHVPEIMTAARDLRHPQTETETILWEQLRDRRLGGYKFRRQYPISHFILDFYCSRARLAVEVDGPSHQQQADYDRWRSELLSDLGIRVLRFTNQDIHTNLAGVLEAICLACRAPRAG